MDPARRLAVHVVLQALADAEQGEQVSTIGLSPWVWAAGLDPARVERAIRAARLRGLRLHGRLALLPGIPVDRMMPANGQRST